VEPDSPHFPYEVLLMLRAWCLAMLFLVLPGRYASADAGSELSANAALKYWQAFATLPKCTDAEQNKLAAGYLTMPLDAQARETVAKADYALQMLHRGAALPRCDWGIGMEEGIYARFAHAPPARVLSALACLRARMRFEEGHNAEALDDLLAGMALARHIGQDGVLILLLFGYTIEHRMGETLALYIPKLDAPTLKNLKTRLDALPPSGTPAKAMRMEEKFGLDWFVRTVKEIKDREKLLSLLSPLFMEPEGRPVPENLAEKGRAFVQACGGTAEGMLKFAEELRPSYARMAQKLDLPPDQFAKEFQAEEQKQAGNPVFKPIFAALHRVRQQQARADVRRALLSAALAVQLEGREALQRHPDPVIGGPFEYIPFAGGFELRSKLKGTDDKPVTLTVGRRG
jgi:hypothetical protein